MSRINDVGGLQGFPLPLSLDDPPFAADWEAHVFGTMYALVKQQVLVLDEVRDAIEQMPVADYLRSSSYEKWLHAMTALLVARGVLDEADLLERPTRSAVSADHAGPEQAVAARVRRLEALLEERGLLDPAQVDQALQAFLARASPATGGRIVARAWVDAAFRERLLGDAGAAVGELGLTMDSGMQALRLEVVENTETSHNVIVCTLCSCYPLALLGPSPAWYKSDGYRSRVVRDPRGVLAEFGLQVPEDVRITVWDATAETRYMVLPRRPPGTDGATERQLAGLVTRDGLIGVAAV